MRFVFAALALAATVGRPDAPGPAVQTIYGPTAPIAAFAQDGTAVAWFTPSASGCNAVHVYDLRYGGRITLPLQTYGARNVTCRWQVVPPVHLAVANANVLWTLREESPLRFDYVLGAGLTDRAERRFQELAHGSHGAGLWLGGVAGDGSTLVYGVTSVDYVDELGCLSGSGSCAMRTVGGGVYRLVGRNQPVLVKGTTAAVEVAASNGAVAEVPTGSVAGDGRPLATPSLPIQVRDAVTGAPISSVQPLGATLAIALAPHVLATLERTKLGLRLAWYDRATGSPSGSIPVPDSTAPELSASDRLIVFHSGRTVRAVSTSTHAVHVLVRTAAPPVGLSLEGGRLAWAENVGGHGRIRALDVGGRG